MPLPVPVVPDFHKTFQSTVLSKLGGPALVIRSHSGDPDCPLCRLDLDLPLDDRTIELVVASVTPCCIRLLFLRPRRSLLLTSVSSSTAVVVSTLVPRAASTLHTRFAD